MSRNRRGFGSLVNGTTYNDRADPRVVQILEAARQSGRRICVRYGDAQTGADWGDRRMCCQIERSSGTMKIPLCIKTARSLGGEGLLEARIVQITDPKTRQKLYENPRYHWPGGAEKYAMDRNAQWHILHPGRR